MDSALLFQLQSFAIVCLMLFGVKLIKENMRRRHIQTMSLAMVWDVLLILQIELSRSAIATASAPVKNSMILNIHIFIAITCVILYLGMLVTGLKVINGQNDWKNLHKKLGGTTVIIRILTFATSFFAV